MDASVKYLEFVPAKWKRWRGLVGGDGQSEEHGVAEKRETNKHGCVKLPLSSLLGLVSLTA